MTRIPIRVANWSATEVRTLARMALTGALVAGDDGPALESRVKEVFGVKHALALARGRAALRLGLAALADGAREEVVLPAYGCRALVEAITAAGLRPVFADVGDDLTLTADTVRPLLGPRTLAVVVVHTYAYPAQLDDLLTLTEPLGVAVVDDAASAMGVRVGSRWLGTAGAFGVFSVAPSKALVAGHGGVLVTNRDDLWARVSGVPLAAPSPADKRAELADFLVRYRYRSSLGRLAEAADRVRWRLSRPRPTARRPATDAVRMPNVDAALTLVQLDRMPQILDGLRAATRRVIAEVLEPAGVEPAPPGHAELLTRMHVVDPRSRVDRTADRVVRHGALRQHLAANGVDTQYGYALLAGPGEADRLPTASSVADRLVRIPCHETLTDGQLARLRDLLAWYFRGRHWQ